MSGGSDKVWDQGQVRGRSEDLCNGRASRWLGAIAG